jgi:orotate phosphoribosyltransferase
VDYSYLAILAKHGFQGLPASRLGDLATWCKDWCAATTDAKYCFLSDVFENIYCHWIEEDEYGGLPESHADALNRLFIESLPRILSEGDSTVAISLIRQLQFQVSDLFNGHADSKHQAAEGHLSSISYLAASYLIQAHAINFRTDPLFTFTSGMRSPIYIDNRRLLGYPAQRASLVRLLVGLVRKFADDRGADISVIAGTATAGIPWASLISAELDLPLAYVRSERKSWGKGEAIEGLVDKGQTVVLVEDLIFTGGSLIRAAGHLRERGANVLGAVALVTYASNQGTKNLDDAKLSVQALTSVQLALQLAQEQGSLSKSELGEIQEWLDTV